MVGVKGKGGAPKENWNAIKDGTTSSIFEELNPMGCQDCTIRSCPYRVVSGNSICYLQKKWVALGTLLGDVYERDALAGFLAAALKVQMYRFAKAFSEESMEGMGLDPEVTKLGHVVAQDTMKLAELQGHIRAGPHVVVDQRQVHVHQEIQRELAEVPEAEFKEVLDAVAQIREVNEKVAMRLMAGETVDVLIGEQLERDEQREKIRAT